jgi:hypothetical protein
MFEREFHPTFSDRSSVEHDPNAASRALATTQRWPPVTPTLSSAPSRRSEAGSALAGSASNLAQ